MSNATPSRLGQIDGAGDADALFLKVFGGMVLEAFDREQAFKNKHIVRTIANGKSAQFPVTGLAGAKYHVPGQELLGDLIRAGERVIVIDDMIVSDAFISNIDELKNHYEVRSIYANEIGQALAKLYDQNVARAIIQAARGAAVVTGLSGGGSDTAAGYANNGTTLYTGIFNAGVALDTKDVPQSERYAGLRPVQYALVVQSEKPLDFDLNQGANPNGSLAMGTVKRINNLELFKTNNLPSADDTANTGIASQLRGDYSGTQGIIFHRGAAGTVQLQDVTMESAYDIRRQGTLMVGKYVVGHDKLRPEAAYELKSA